MKSHDECIEILRGWVPRRLSSGPIQGDVLLREATEQRLLCKAREHLGVFMVRDLLSETMIALHREGVIEHDGDSPKLSREWRLKPPEPPRMPDDILTERIADELALHELGLSNAELARRLGVETEETEWLLYDMQRLGLVYKVGRTKGTRWRLG